jgi:N,N'-diacetyllegionaminate synthase
MALINLKKTQYQKKNSLDKLENQFSMLRKLSLTKDDFDKLIKYCKKIKIKFLASVFDSDSLEYVRKKSQIIKIGSSEASNYFLLKDIAKFNKYLIISTGLNNYQGIKKTLDVLKKYGQSKKKITLLHCNTAYPTPFSDTNLLTIQKLKKLFKIKCWVF